MDHRNSLYYTRPAKEWTQALPVEIYQTLWDRLTYDVFGSALAASLFSMYGGPLVFVVAPFMFLVYLPVMAVVEVFRWIFGPH